MLRKSLTLWLGVATVLVYVALATPSALADGDRIHKVVAAPGVLDSQAEGITLWHDYGAFALYRVTDSALADLPRRVRKQITLTDPWDRWWLLSAFEASLSAAQEESRELSEAEKDAAGMGAPTTSGPALHLVQFVGPIKQEWLQAVETTGARLIQYIATNGYLLWADAESRAELDRLAAEGQFVQQSALYPTALKVGPALLDRLDVIEDQGTVLPVLIQMYRHEDAKLTEILIEELAVTVVADWIPVLSYQNIIVTLRLGDVQSIIDRPDVYWIEERLERHLMDEVQGQIMASNFNADQSGPSAPGYLTWLGPYGFSTDPADYPIVDVTDDGIGNGTVNSGDPTLHEFGNIALPTRLAYVANCTNSADGGGPDGHGHINTSIAAGYDTTSGFPYVDPLGYQRGLGINPYGRFAGTRVFDPGFDQSACGNTDTGVIKSIQDNGALINTNSWGCSGCAGTYDDSSQAYDVGVRDADLVEPGNQEMIILFSAGNSGPGSGTVGTPGNGKNMITVGASENQRPSDEDGLWTDGCGIGPTGADDAMDVIDFSSRGPSPGNRVKPEVIAPGTHVQGTASTSASYNGSGVCDQYRPSGQTIFAASSGTSHSTPAVAGTASLAYWWLQNIYGLGAPSPAMMKAYLIAHPTYLTGVSANDTLPSNSQGYGMPDMTRIFDDAAKYLLDQSVTFDNSGETWVWEGAVADPTKPVRIVMTFTDAPGAIGTSPQVNDLNLAVTLGSSTYRGNVFSGQWSVTGGSVDPFNNYEAVFLPAGTDGAIDITVTGFNIAGDGIPNSGDGTDQDFAIVCYNCAQTPTFSLAVTPSSQSICAPDDATYDVDVGSVLGFTDPVTLSASGNPAGTTVSFSVNPVTPPGSSTLTVGNTGSASAGSYSIEVTGIASAGSKSVTVGLDLYTATPLPPDLLTPADGATNVAFRPVFSWTAEAQAASYLLEVATDPVYANIVYSATELGTSHKAAVPLSANATYYWRVTAQSVCGSATSFTFSFTTQAATMVCNGAPVDFEDGIPADWTVVDNTGGTGIYWVTTADPACEIPNRTNGSGEAACADSDAAGTPATPYDTELISNPLDLSAVGAAVLDVKAYYRDITTGSNDRLEVDVWDGVSWTNELSWDEDHEPEDFTLNLSAYAGLPMVQIRFRYFGNGFDWYAQVDDIDLTCIPPSDPAIEVDPAFLAAMQGPNVVTTQPLIVTNSGGSPLTWSIVEDDSACDSPTDIPWLSVAPNTGTTTPLDSTFANVAFDSTGLAPGGYAANLCVTSDDPATPVVQVPVTLTVEPPVLLLCNNGAIDFEDGLPSGWQLVDNTGGTGIVWVTTADPACEIPNRTNGTGEAACADSDAAGFPAIPYDTELWTNPIDLSTYGAVQLDVKAYYRDLNTGSNDRFEVDVWDGLSWINELSWDEDHEPEDFTLNLSAYGGLTGVRIRFRYFGNGYDWYAQVDDVALTCIAGSVPVIGVSPASLASSQGPDVVRVESLSISNTGGGALNWSIAEDDTGCDSPTDIPWLSVAPDTGTTPPLGSSDVDVTFDSTGLTPGDYMANLCVSSNDTVTPLVQVPVTLTVLPPLVLACNGEIADFDSGIPPGWQVIDNEGNGVVWTDIAGSGETGNYTGGGGDAATASSDRAGPVQYDTELRTTAIDLSTWLPTDQLALEYLANYQNFAARDFLDLDISTDGGATWTTLLSWNEDHGSFRRPPGEAVSIDLSAYAGMSGLKLRWHYYDPTTSDFDWYAQIDEVGLSCIATPVIDVDPASLASTQVPGQLEVKPLTLHNLGSADLIWSIDEAPFRSPTGFPGLPLALTALGDQSLDRGNDFAPWTVPIAPRDVGVHGILINDGSFENGPPPASAWTETADNVCEWIGDWSTIWGAAAFDGVYDFWGGGYCGGIPSTDSVEQSIVVPTGGELVFWYLAYRVDADDSAVDYAYVAVDGVEVWTLDLVQANNTFPNWVQATVNLAAYGGQTVDLELGVVSSGDQTGNIRFDFVQFGSGCETPSDIPWLSVAPDAGTTPPADSTAVDAAFDSTGLVPGSYAANLCVNSNDPATPLVAVPVDLTVQPFDISLAKSALPTSIDEPGDIVQFTLVVTNHSPVAATIETFSDTDFDLSVECPGAVGTVVPAGLAYTCVFSELIAGNAFEDHEDIATVAASDGWGNSDSASDNAQVAIQDVAPAISVEKSGPSYGYQGAEVAFTVSVTNLSVATDPVMIISIVDDVYGDVTAVHDDVTATDCATGILVVPGDTYSCSFSALLPSDLVGDQTDRVTVTGTDDEGNAAVDDGDATVTVLPPSAATDSSLCLFDRYGDTPEREFRLLFTPDLRLRDVFKLTASNPGQFYHNVFHVGEGPATIEITVPYPFVTQGAMPVHVYSGVSVYVNSKGESCFLPEGAGTPFAEIVELEDHVDTDGDGKPDSATVTLVNVAVTDGFAYANIHLDHGFKGTDVRFVQAVNPDGTVDAVDPDDPSEVLIGDRTVHAFGFAVDGVPLAGDELVNVNDFKRIPGVGGFVWQGATVNPVEGAVVKLIPPDGSSGADGLEAVTDGDGWYMIIHKHRGRRADYGIEVWIGGSLVADEVVSLKGNASVEKNFLLP